MPAFAGMTFTVDSCCAPHVIPAEAGIHASIEISSGLHLWQEGRRTVIPASAQRMSGNPEARDELAAGFPLAC